MKNKLDYIDAPDRAQYILKVSATDRIDVLESDHSVLFARLMRFAASAPIPCRDGRQYTLNELMKHQPLFILEQIRSCSGDEKEEIIDEYLTGWSALLSHSPALKLSQVVANLIKKDIPAKECLHILQSAGDEFRRDIEQTGITDPALATLDTFIHNYRQIVTGFNELWERLSAFYVSNVLHLKSLPAQPDQTWLVLEKREDTHDVVVPEQTAFVAGRNADGTDFCYYSTEPVTVTGMKLHSASSVLFQQKELLVNGRRQQFVGTILQKKIPMVYSGQPVTLFDTEARRDNDHTFITTGLMIESPMFILQEGHRSVTLRLHLTPESMAFFREYGQKMTGSFDDKNNYYRLLNTAFYLEISTSEGWTNISDYELKYETEANKGYFRITFLLKYDFPAPVACSAQHDSITKMPALRVLINRDAPIFPYTWARQLLFSAITIQCEVEGVHTLLLANEQGLLDAASSFYPFGVQGEKGAWLNIGNYEASVKPLTEVKLTLKWQQLPQEEGGFTTYYQDYRKGINNRSFKVKTEYLNESTWIETSPLRSDLFAVDHSGQTVLQESNIVWSLNKRMNVYMQDPERFVYSIAPSGFIRMVLDEPGCGFGHSLYQQIFINDLLRRGNKEEVKLIKPPFVPVVNGIKLQYKAEETIQIVSDRKQSLSRLYYLEPISADKMRPVTKDIFALVDGPPEEGYLKLAFSNAIGYQTICLHVELIPWHQEFEKSEMAPVKWYYHNGKQWLRLEEKDILRDETGNFLNSGLIEIKLPSRITSANLDTQHLFWLYAAFERNQLNYPYVYGFFLNTVRVVAQLSDHPEDPSGTENLPAGTIHSFHEEISGINSIRQIRSGMSGIERESLDNMLFRSSNQALFRYKPSTAEDYERLVLEKFPQIGKVKCFPACDTKNSGRKGVVTLAVMQKRPDEELPLCPYNLLFEIEKQIGAHAGPFVIVDAINPVFEQILIRSHVSLKPGILQGLFQKSVKKILDDYIAPWKTNRRFPSFGRTYTVAEVRTLLENQPEIEQVYHVSLIMVMTSTQKATLESLKMQKLLEFSDKEKAYYPIKASHPWYIQTPANNHFIFTGSAEEYSEKIGTGELEIDNTFIIK